MAAKPVKYKWESWNDFLELSNYVVLDIETTGLAMEKEKIIEIAMIQVVGGVQTKIFHSLVNPEKEIPTRVSNLTHISGDDVSSAPTFAALADSIIDFIGDDIIFAHNASFVVRFVSHELAACKKEQKFVYFDSIPLAKKAFPSLPNYKLETIISHLQLSDKKTHRALDNAERTLQLIQVISDRYSSSLALAAWRCCAPIVDYSLQPSCVQPLEGLHFALFGEFTFSRSSAKNLIDVAGGIVDERLTKETDYLIYGYFDPLKNTSGAAAVVSRIKREYQEGAHTKLINEVGLLRLCGVVFNYSED